MNKLHSESGQAALILMLLALAFAVVITTGINSVAVRRQVSVRDKENSVQSYYVAEAGIEDSLLRLINPSYTHQDNVTLNINGQTATIAITETGDTLSITSAGDANSRIRKLSTQLQENTTGASFFYGIQVDDGGITMSNNSRVNGNVYSNGDIVGSNGATITGDATVAGALDDTAAVEWTTQTADQFFATASNNRDIAQSFTANETGALPQVSVYLGKVGNPTSNLTLRLTSDNSGKPTTTSLASATIAYTSVNTTPGWITASFTSPPNVTNGTKYWIVLDYGSNSATNYWNWRKDSTGGYPNNTGSTTANWSQNGATWISVNGDLAFQVWIGGSIKKIQDITIGTSSTGTGHANQFINTTIHGSACPNQYCIVENPERQELPISEETIQSWKDDAEGGGTHSGDYSLTGNNVSATLGPKKITGDLNVTNGATVTLTGTLWVQGDINLSNGCHISLDPSYGTSSGEIITDGVINIANNCTFSGSGQTGSYILLLSDKDDTAHAVMDISNNSAGVVYYAPRGLLHFSNNATAKEATAYGLIMDNSATITYETGLQNMNFSSGPAGGWTFGTWREID